MPPQECIDDTDRNGVFKIANKEQVVAIIQSNATQSRMDEYDLSRLEFVAADTGV